MPPILGAVLLLERCPHCSVDRPNLVQRHAFETNSHDGAKKRLWSFYACQRCGGVVTAANTLGSHYPVEECYPSATEVDEAIPQRAREYLSQAINSLSAPAGAIMLAASAVDAMLKAKGLKEGTLYTRIAQAATAHTITNEMAQWAHDVRLDANDQRHSDEDSSLPTSVDANRAIEFATALGQFMFVLPARIQRGLKDAEAGKAVTV